MIPKMIKLLKLVRPWSGGFFTGLTAHLGAATVVFSAEHIAHFVGHVVAAILMRWGR